mgnify:CR=1 FL=1
MTTAVRTSMTAISLGVRVNVFTEHGACSKTCATVSEAEAFIAAVKANKTSVKGRTL